MNSFLPFAKFNYANILSSETAKKGKTMVVVTRREKRSLRVPIGVLTPIWSYIRLPYLLVDAKR